MRFRSIVASLACSLFATPLAAMEKPYRVALVGGAHDGKAWHAGVRVELDKGWKTYWRMPGEAGIPPDFSWTTSVPAEVTVSYPVPRRFADASGEAVGYEDEVVFPVAVEAGAATAVKLELALFFAVCKDICIPAKAQGMIELGPVARDPAGARLVESAEASVPVDTAIVKSAEIVAADGKPVLRLSLLRAVDDVFVETATTAYFRKPDFANGGSDASLVIDNLANPTGLKGTMLKLTFRIGKTGLEQTVTLP